MNRYISVMMFMAAAMVCDVGHSQSQSEMNQSAEADFEKADAKLNAVYKKLLATLDADGKKKLIAAERAWVAYRDAEADFEADAAARGGSMAPMIYSGTCSRLTEARIKELQDVISGQ